MKQKFFVWAIVGLLMAVLLAGCTQSNATAPPASNAPPAANIGGTNAPPANGGTAALSATVNITENGYVPQTVTIKKGGTITWVNTTDSPNWPATAQHPTHTVYPGSDIEKCGTPEETAIFDACKGLAKGESYSFTFNNAGEWGYHEHVDFKMFGKVIVVSQ